MLFVYLIRLKIGKIEKGMAINMIRKNNVNHISYPLHVAAALGDIAYLEKLLPFEYNDNIDSRDDLNLTPLQIAAVSGQVEAVKFLISKGANISASDGYDQDFSALTLAVWQGHPEIVKIIVEEQKRSGLMNPKEMLFPLLYNLENLFVLIQEADVNPKPFEDALDIFFMLISSQKLPLLDFEDSDLDEMGSEPTLPALVSLESLTRYAPTKEIYNQVMSKIIEINAQDTCYQTYLDAKFLLHVFPIDEPYCKILYQTPQGDEYEYFMSPEGFMACFTTPFASNEIDCYRNSLGVDDSQTLSAFTDISQIYHQAILFSKEQSIFENSQLAYDLYQQGQILLLATGWEGHAVNVILDPLHQYFIVANGGARYENFVSGAYVYKMHNPQNLTAQLIFDILNNVEQVDLELTYKYKLALDKLDILEHPEQEYGNCAWYSHKPAIEALLYIHFLNEGLDNTTAKVLAQEHYLEWEVYENFHCLETYFDHNPKLDINTVLDILSDYHPSLFKDSEDEIDLGEYHQAEYLVGVLASEQYRDDFYDHFLWKFSCAKPELIDLFGSVGLPVYLADSSDQSEIQPINFSPSNLLDEFCLQQAQAF